MITRKTWKASSPFLSGFVHLLTSLTESLENCLRGSTNCTIWSMAKTCVCLSRRSWVNKSALDLLRRPFDSQAKTFWVIWKFFQLRCPGIQCLHCDSNINRTHIFNRCDICPATLDPRQRKTLPTKLFHTFCFALSPVHFDARCRYEVSKGFVPLWFVPVLNF